MFDICTDVHFDSHMSVQLFVIRLAAQKLVNRSVPCSSV